MSVQIIVKNSSVEDKRPTSGQLAEGEIALNYNAAGAFLTCKDTNGDIQQVGGVKISENAPSDPPKQCLWFKPSTLTLFVYDGTTFLPLTGGGGGGGGGSVDQVVGSDGIDAVTNSGVVTVSVDLVDSRGLIISGGKLAGNIATTSDLGVIKVGSNLTIDPDGTLNAASPGVSSVNLGYTAAASGGTVTNDAGNDASIPDATDTTAGLFTGAEKLKLAGIEDGATAGGGGLSSVNLGYTAATSGGTVTNDAGNDASIPDATNTNAGLFTGAEKQKLAGIDDNANVGLTAVNLGYTAAASGGTVTNDAGNDASIPDATDTEAGLFTGAEKLKLAGIEDGATAGGGITGVTGGDGITVTNDTEVAVDITGEGLEISGGQLQASIATGSTLGVVKAGSGIGITPDGTISATGTVTIDLGYTADVDKGTITNTGGTEAEIPLADVTNAGLFSATEKTKLAGIDAGANVGLTAVNLDYTAAASGGTVTNDAGNNASIPDATNTTAGLFTGAEKQKLAGIANNANVGLTAVNLGYTAAVSGGTVTNDAGNNSTIPDADATNAGLFTAAEKLKLAGIEDGATAGGGGLTSVNLGYTAATSGGTVTNDAGNNASIPNATNTNAGLFTGAEKQKLAGIDDNAKNNTSNDARYLRKDVNDTADGIITLKDGLIVQNGTDTTSIGRFKASAGPVFEFMSGTADKPKLRIFGGSSNIAPVVFDVNTLEAANSAVGVIRRYRNDGGISNRTKAIQVTLQPDNVQLRGGSNNSNNQPACYASAITFTDRTDISTLSAFNVQATTSSQPNITTTWEIYNGFQFAGGSVGYNDGTPDISLRNTKIRGVSIGLENDGSEAGSTNVFQIYAQGSAPSYFRGAIKTGQGIEFNGNKDVDTSVDANILHDYEEGTYIPTILGSSTTVSYTSQFGSYVIIGKTCTVTGNIAFSGASGSTQISISMPISASPIGNSSTGAGVTGSFFITGAATALDYNVNGRLAGSAEMGLGRGNVRTGNNNAERLRCDDLPQGSVRFSVTYTV